MTEVPTELPNPIDPPLDFIVEAAFGADPVGNPLEWTWTDITADVKVVDGVRSRRGRQGETRRVSPGSVSFALSNDDGKYTPENPRSPLYPNIVLGTPVRVRPIPDEGDLVSLADSFDRVVTGQWGDPDEGRRWGSGVTEGSNVYTDGSRGIVQPAVANGGAVMLNSAQFFDGDITVKIGASGVIAGADGLVAGIAYRWVGYYLAALLLDASGNVTLQLYNELGNTLIGQVSNIDTYAAGDEFWLAIRATGDRHQVKLWRVGEPQPAGFHIDVTDTGTPSDPSLISGPFGGLGGGFVEGWVAGFVQLVGEDTNDVRVTFDDLTAINRNTPLFLGHASEWTPDWPEGDMSTDYDEGYSRVEVVVGGPLRRLAQDNNTPLASPMQRAVLGFTSSSTPVRAYWPMEEPGRDVTEFSSPLPGVEPITTDGTVSPGTGDMSTVPGSEPLPEFDEGATYIAPVPIGSYPHGWIVNHWFRMDNVITGTGGGPRTVTRVDTQDSDVAHWRARVTDAGEIFVEGIDDNWNQINSFSTSITDEAFYNRWLVISFRVSMDTDNLAFNYTVYAADTLNENVATEVVAEIEAVIVSSADGSGQPTRLAVFNMGPNTERHWGHITVASIEANFSPDGTLLFDTDAPSGYDGEPATIRVARLGRQENMAVGFILTESGQTSEQMGPQPTGRTLFEILEQCETAEGGVISESRYHPGLVWRQRSSMYQQRPRMVLDAAAGHAINPLRPILDDLRVGNDVTARRPDGSAARATDEAHILRHGRYPRRPTVNVSSPEQLPDIAAWYLHVGTQPGMRYPNITPYLSGYVELMPPWLLLEIGDLVRITNLPPQHPPDVVDVLMQGTTDRVTPETWNAGLNAIPADAWNDVMSWQNDIPGSGACISGRPGDYLSTPDDPAASVTEDLDVAFDATCTTWNRFDPSGPPDIRRIGPAKWIDPNPPPLNSYFLDVVGGFPRLGWSPDGSSFMRMNSRIAVPVTGGERAAIRATLDVDNGDGGHDVRFYYAPSMHAVQGMLAQDDGHASTPDAPHLQNTTDLDVRVEIISDRRQFIEPPDPTQGFPNLISKDDPAPERGWNVGITVGGDLQFAWSSDGTDANILNVTSPVPIPGAFGTFPAPIAGGRIALRVVLVADHNDDGTLFALSFFFAHSIEGPWYQIRQILLFEDQNAGLGGPTQIHPTSAPLRVGPQADGLPVTVTRAEVYSGVAYPYPTPGPDDPIVPTGVQTASPNFRNLPHGTTSFPDAQDNPWTLNGDAEISPWALMDTVSDTGGTTAVASTEAPIEFGSLDDGGRGNRAKDDKPTPMKVHSAYVKDGINGTPLTNPQFEDLPPGTRQFTDAAGRTYNLHGQAAICGAGDTEALALSRLSPTDAYLAFDTSTETEAVDVVLDVRRPLNPAPGFEDSDVSILQDTDSAATTFTNYLVTNGTGRRVTTRQFRGLASGLFTFDGGNPGAVSTQAFFGGGTNNTWRRASVWAWSPVDVSLFVAIAFFDSDGQGAPLDRRQVYYSNAIFVAAGVWTRVTVGGAATDGTDVSDPQDAEAVTTAAALVFINGAPASGQQLYLDEFKFGMDSAPFVATHEAPHQFPFDIQVGGEVMRVVAADPVNRHNVQRLYVQRGRDGSPAVAHSAGESVALNPEPTLAW